MLEAFITQVLSFWVIACAFGCYFSLDAQNNDY